MAQSQIKLYYKNETKACHMLYITPDRPLLEIKMIKHYLKSHVSDPFESAPSSLI